MKFDRLSKPLQRLSILQRILAVKGAAPKYDTVFAYKRPADGRVLWCRDLGTVIRDASGKTTDIYGVTMDITTAREAEDAIRAAKEAAGCDS